MFIENPGQYYSAYSLDSNYPLGVCLGFYISIPYPRLLNQHIWKWDPRVYTIISFPGDSYMQQNLRKIILILSF
jgi:hypothetical protein